MNDHSLPDAPVYIGGPERSGKTYMRLMLAAHPTLAFSKRTGLWTHIYGRYGDLAQPANMDRCLDALRRNKHVRALEPDEARLRREVASDPSYAHLFALLHRHHAERRNSSRWGDQTELVERRAEAIFAAFPAARFIHMLRDPRDWYEAIVARGPGRPGRLGEATARWRLSAELALRNERLYPDRYRVVRYEAMVAHPAETLTEICGLLDIEPTPAMLALGHADRFGQNPEGASPLSTAYIGRFRTRLAAHEWDYIQRHTASLMATFDYPLEPVRLSPADRLRCRTLTPLAASLARVAGAARAGWRAAER